MCVCVCVCVCVSVCVVLSNSSAWRDLNGYNIMKSAFNLWKLHLFTYSCYDNPRGDRTSDTENTKH